MIVMGVMSIIQFILEKIDEGNEPPGPDAVTFLAKLVGLA